MNSSISALPFPLPFPLPLPGFGTDAFGVFDSTMTDLSRSSARASSRGSTDGPWVAGAALRILGISRAIRSRSSGSENRLSSDRALSRFRGSAGAASARISRTGAWGSAATTSSSGLGSGLPRTAWTDARSSAILRGFSKYSEAP